jgi:hypothetical protein
MIPTTFHIEVTPRTMLTMNQTKYRQLCQQGFRFEIADFLTRHCEGDPGDGNPRLTDAMNRSATPVHFVSCFLLPDGRRVEIRSHFDPDGTIHRMIIELP